MRYDWNLQQCWGFALVLACSLGVAACGHNTPNGAKSSQPPSGAPNFPAAAKVAGGNGHTISRDAVDKVTTGMSDSDVKQLLGAPTMESSLGGSAVMMTWYDAENQYLQIIVDKGRVTQKTYGGQDQHGGKFTQAKLDQVKTGMTEAKVLELLGPSKAEVNTGDQRVLSWESSSQLVTIIFRKGKVDSKFATPK